MQSNELSYMETLQEIAYYIVALNDRTRESSDWSDESLEANLRYFNSGMEPMIWDWKGYNRQHCYSVLFSKLFLALLISDNSLMGQTPEEIQRLATLPVEVWTDFKYDFDADDNSIGRNISTVLDTMYCNFLKRSPYFKHSCDYIEIGEMSGIYNEELGEGEYRRIFLDNLYNLYPEIKKHGSITEDDFWFIDPGFSDAVICLDIISSSFLYDIFKKPEDVLSTLELEIKNLATAIFPDSLVRPQSETIGLSFYYLDDDLQQFVSYTISISDIFGDGRHWQLEIDEMLFHYSHLSMLRLVELHNLINQYEKESENAQLI